MDLPRRAPTGPTLVETAFTGPVAVAPETTFERCSFEGAMLQGADLARCRFVDCRFASSNLSVVRVGEASFQTATFVDSKLAGVDWTQAARFALVAFERCVLDGCAFVEMDLRRAVFRGSRLRDAAFAGADLSGADLRDCDLTGAQFVRTKLAGADLRAARGYAIHPCQNDVAGLRASMPDAVGLVLPLGVEIEL
jgi:fluoroquinolone resistance protein